MTPYFLNLFFSISAMAGGIICGIVLCKARTSTKWRSKLGAWAIVGLILLSVGLGGATIMVKIIPSADTHLIMDKHM